MGASESKLTDTIKWNNVNTNDFSSNIPNINNISHQAKELIDNLNVEINSDTISSDINLKSIFNTKKKPLSKTKVNTKSDSNMSSSPFITTEMYKHILNKYNNKNIVQNTMTGGGGDDDNTSTSSSLSSSASDDLSSSSVSSNTKKLNKDKKKIIDNKKNNKKDIDNKKDIYNKKNNKKDYKKDNKHTNIKNKIHKNKKNSTESLNLSYISSSAHTGGGSVSNNSSIKSTSIKNENDYNQSS
jgi:hypothetical protein